jgi:hypothetical protein
MAVWGNNESNPDGRGGEKTTVHSSAQGFFALHPSFLEKTTFREA